MDFDLKRVVPVQVAWCDWNGGKPRMAGPSPSVELVSAGSVLASPILVIFRDPRTFVAGEIHRHLDLWDWVVQEYPKRQEIFSFLSQEVKVSASLSITERISSNSFDSPFPPSAIFPTSCQPFDDFFSTTILDRVVNGSLSIWGIRGRIGEVNPPHLAIPITTPYVP